MKIVTQEMRARSAPMAWFRYYSQMPENRRPSITGRFWEKIYDELRAIKNITPEDVNRITGSDKWTSVQCDACGLNVHGAAEFEASEWPIYICHNCLIEAANKLILEIAK